MLESIKVLINTAVKAGEPVEEFLKECLAELGVDNPINAEEVVKSVQKKSTKTTKVPKASKKAPVRKTPKERAAKKPVAKKASTKDTTTNAWNPKQFNVAKDKIKYAEPTQRRDPEEVMDVICMCGAKNRVRASYFSEFREVYKCDKCIARGR